MFVLPGIFNTLRKKKYCVFAKDKENKVQKSPQCLRLCVIHLISPFSVSRVPRAGCNMCHVPVTLIPCRLLVSWAGLSLMCICTLHGPQTPSHVNVHPFPSLDKPCELYCSPLGKESPLLVADRVLDGTPCGPYETDLCVHGRCQVTCFPCVLGRALEGRLPPEGLRVAGAWVRNCIGGAATCSLAPLPPSAVTEHEAQVQANQELRC